MQKIESRLTVFFEPPFWVAIYERICDGKLEVCKVTFGAEPKDYEVYAFFLDNWASLRFSPPVKQDAQSEMKRNPKRMQREIKKQLDSHGVGTKSQQAIKLQHEEGKAIRKQKSRTQKDAEIERRFELRQQKKKEKHRGR